MASAECSAEDRNRLVFEAVNEISVSKFQSIISSYSKIEVLTSLVKCNENSETPLVIAMKGRNVELIDELVKFLRNCDHVAAKCHEMFLISIEQLFHHQIPVIELIFHLTKHFPYTILRVKDSEWLDIIARVVFKSTSLSRQDKITALELIGASLQNFYQDHSFLVKFRCWKEAMTLRYFPADGEPLLPKIPYVGVPSVASSVVFGSAEEVMTLEELDLLEEDLKRVVDLDPEVRLRCIVLMQRQCLLVIRRICCQVNHGQPHFFYLQSLYENGIGMMQDCQVYGVDNIVQHNIDSRIVINTFLLILEQMTGFDPILFNIFINALRVVSHLLAFMARIPPGYPGREFREELSYTNLLAATTFIGTIAKFFPDPAMISVIEFHSEDYFEVEVLISVMGKMIGSSFDGHYHGFAKIVYDLVFVLESMSPQLNNQEEQKIGEHLSYYIRNYFLERTTSVLHAGVVGLLESGGNLKTIKLILRLGADPNAINEIGETPLHWLAGVKFANSDENLPVFQALVDAGGHRNIDTAADDGKTVLDILKEYLDTYEDERYAAADNYFSSLINKVFPLSCYCARVIRRHGIQFDEDRIPLHLQPFVSRHSNR